MLDQPISRLIKGFRNWNIKWGSKDLNDRVCKYDHYEDYFTGKDMDIVDLTNDLCKNTVVCSMAISALLKFIFTDYEKAVEDNDEEFKYVCWIRYQKTIRLAEEMNLGTGSFGKTHATFDNIGYYTAKGIHNLFLFDYKENLSDRDLNKLESIYDSFNISEERKEEIKKICGEPRDIQIDPSNTYDKTYKGNK